MHRGDENSCFATPLAREEFANELFFGWNVEFLASGAFLLFHKGKVGIMDTLVEGENLEWLMNSCVNIE